MNSTKTCGRCKVDKPLTAEFFEPRGHSFRGTCRECRNERKLLGKEQYKFICKHCKEEYLAKEANRSTYCSRDCFFADIKAGSKPKKQPPVTTCKICASNFQPHRLGVLFCSDDCRRERDRRKSITYYKLHLAADVVNEERSLTCRYCNDLFQTTRSNIVYCSISCQKKASKSERRHRKRGQFVAPVYRNEIIKRDKGVCQICKTKVDMRVKAPHPLSASLDHIIPLSKGGTHEPANVQLAHFLCNSIKSDAMPDALAQ